MYEPLWRFLLNLMFLSSLFSFFLSIKLKIVVPNDGDKNKEHNKEEQHKFHVDKYIFKSPIFQKISRKFQKTKTPFFNKGGHVLENGIFIIE